ARRRRPPRGSGGPRRPARRRPQARLHRLRPRIAGAVPAFLQGEAAAGQGRLGGRVDMSQGVTSRTEATVVARVAESCPKAREFPEHLLVLLGLTALVLALAAWAH